MMCKCGKCLGLLSIGLIVTDYRVGCTHTYLDTHTQTHKPSHTTATSTHAYAYAYTRTHANTHAKAHSIFISPYSLTGLPWMDAHDERNPPEYFLHWLCNVNLHTKTCVGRPAHKARRYMKLDPYLIVAAVNAF